MDGVELLKRLRADTRTCALPVVVLGSMRADRDAMAACAHHAANSCVVKPVDFDAFSRTLENLCRYWLGINVAPEWFLDPRGRLWRGSGAQTAVRPVDAVATGDALEKLPPALYFAEALGDQLAVQAVLVGEFAQPRARKRDHARRIYRAWPLFIIERDQRVDQRGFLAFRPRQPVFVAQDQRGAFGVEGGAESVEQCSVHVLVEFAADCRALGQSDH
jgi:hypothetical protein